MAFSDIYEIKDEQSVGTQSVLNIYHVEKLNPAFTALNIAIAFRDTVIPPMLAVQPTGLTHVVITVRSLDDPLDFAAVTAIPGLGLLVGDPLNTFSAAAIQFNRLRTDMKNGQKRFEAGVEGAISGNTWGGPFVTDLQTLGTAIVSTWEEAAAPGIPVCNYVIIKRVCTVQPPPTPCPKYRLPENDAELVSYRPVTFVVRDLVRSQVSRKRLV